MRLKLRNKFVTELLVYNYAFEELFLEVVDEIFSLFGEECKQMIYSYIRKHFHLKRKDIPHKIKEFAEALERTFGIGAKLIEIQIIKNLYEKVGYSFKFFPSNENLDFIEYVKAVESFLKFKSVVNIKSEDYRRLLMEIGKIKTIEQIKIVEKVIQEAYNAHKITYDEKYELYSKLNEQASIVGKKRISFKVGPLEIAGEKEGKIL